MKVFGWIVLVLGLLGCIWAGIVGSATAGDHGANAVAVGLGALGGIYAGLKLIGR